MNIYKHQTSGRSLPPIMPLLRRLRRAPCTRKAYISEPKTSMKGIRGRSMIEMLGVLAIIGVLSAGGIMGYTMAMENYRINQTIEDIQTIASKAANYFSQAKIPPAKTQQELHANTINSKQLFLIGIIPEKYKLNDKETCGSGLYYEYACYSKSLFKTDLLIHVHGPYLTQTANRIGFEIDKPHKAACIKLLTHNWNGSGMNYLIGYRTGKDLTPPVSIKEAETICQTSFKYIVVSYLF